MRTIIVPHVTEKSMQKINDGLYVFRVMKDAVSGEVKDAVEKLYNVHVADIRIVNLPAKKKVFKRIKGTRAEIRKAYVHLKKGEKIAGFETVAEPKSDAGNEKKDK